VSDIAITCEAIAKHYRIGERESYKALRDVITDAFKSPFRRLRQATGASGSNGNGKPMIWALQDVSFEVKQGEVVGIIGRNGAGKSTLLKILSRITEPTRGYAEIHGRVGSLLEVGTGFHPELTGRENIFLYGAILGMKKAEIARKFDEIVAFAEVAKFIDTPVKRYSSGMYVRLAFAVAAHMETEILLVDEVLAVGDVQFQRKCLGRMDDVARQGRTVLFVSHSMNSVEHLCKRAILLDSGSLKIDSTYVRSVLTTYMSGDMGPYGKSVWVSEGCTFSNPYFEPIRMAIVDSDGRELSMPVRNDADVWIEIVGNVSIADPALTLGYGMFDESGQLLYWTCQTDQRDADWPVIRPGRVHLRGKFPNRLLNEGNYRLELLVSLHYRQWILQPGSGSPHVFLSIQGGLSDSSYWMMKRPGVLAPNILWCEPNR
jgi:lipopolysaccharide transport system ATP-binding protein